MKRIYSLINFNEQKNFGKGYPELISVQLTNIFIKKLYIHLTLIDIMTILKYTTFLAFFL